MYLSSSSSQYLQFFPSSSLSLTLSSFFQFVLHLFLRIFLVMPCQIFPLYQLFPLCIALPYLSSSGHCIELGLCFSCHLCFSPGHYFIFIYGVACVIFHFEVFTLWFTFSCLCCLLSLFLFLLCLLSSLGNNGVSRFLFPFFLSLLFVITFFLYLPFIFRFNRCVADGDVFPPPRNCTCMIVQAMFIDLLTLLYSNKLIF